MVWLVQGKQGVEALQQPCLSAFSTLSHSHCVLGNGPPGMRAAARGVLRTLAASRLELFQAGSGRAQQGLLSERAAN